MGTHCFRSRHQEVESLAIKAQERARDSADYSAREFKYHHPLNSISLVQLLSIAF